jgi:NACHT domain
VLVNPVDVIDGVLVNTIWSVGQMVVRRPGARRVAANMDIIGWADTKALIIEALPDLQLDLPGLTEVDAEAIVVTLKRDEVQGALQALLAARLTDAPETDAAKAREAVRLGLLGHQPPGELVLDAGAHYAEQLSEYLDDKICALVANLEGRVGLAGLAQVRAESYNARIVALLDAIERQVAALADPGRGGRTEGEFLKRYRRQMRQKHGRIEPPDFDRRRLIPIANIYVPMEIADYDPNGVLQFSLSDVSVFLRPAAESECPAEGQSFEMKPSPDGLSAVSLSVPDLKGMLDRTVLLGDPGGGKTTAAKFLVNEFAADPTGKIPFLVTLREYAAKTPLEWSVAGYIEATLSTLYQVPAPDGLIERLLLTGRAIVIFDGLDELLDTSRRREVSERVEQFCSAYPLTSVLVTSRAVGYDQARLDEEQFTCYKLGGFGDEEATEYVGKWFSSQDGTSPAEAEAKAKAFLKESDDAKDLRANPLLLSLMCILYRGAGSLPGDRAGVYSKCAELLLRKWDEQRDLYRKLRADYLVEPTLRHLAWWLLTREDTSAAATERELVFEASEFLLGRGFEGVNEAQGAAAEFVEFCRGRMWVFSEAGTTAAGDKLYAFTHRTFLEYFAAWQMAATSDTAEDLADRLITSIGSSGWEVVGELAVQIKDRNTDQGADRVYQRILARIEDTSDHVRTLFLMLLIEWMPGMAVSPIVTRRVTRAALAQTIASDSATTLLWGLQRCGTRHQRTVADELHTGIAAMVASDQELTKLVGLQLALCMVRVSRDDYWISWSMELSAPYQADIHAFSVRSPALRTVALHTSAISIDQALAMPGGFGALIQRHPIIGAPPFVPYPLYVSIVASGKTAHLPSIARLATIGHYLVDHPSLPWATGPLDRFNVIVEPLGEHANAALDEFSGLGAAAASAVHAEFRGDDRKSIGLGIEGMLIPTQFRKLFRDWADGKVDLVKLISLFLHKGSASLYGSRTRSSRRTKFYGTGVLRPASRAVMRADQN